ncbi:hypothetical protein AABC73_06860 [Pseudomonas sp. G.S.17]|uniref:hypothetical protein n=1 Tax=Pseudomonas sp. G.S.17 TaxID=3137451 RepID=UPI00311C9EE8
MAATVHDYHLAVLKREVRVMEVAVIEMQKHSATLRAEQLDHIANELDVEIARLLLAIKEIKASAGLDPG